MAFEIRVRSEFRLLNDFYENLITSLTLKYIYNIKKFIVEVGILPGNDAVSLRYYFLCSRSILVPSSSGSSSEVRLRRSRR